MQASHARGTRHSARYPASCSRPHRALSDQTEESTGPTTSQRISRIRGQIHIFLDFQRTIGAAMCQNIIGVAARSSVSGASSQSGPVLACRVGVTHQFAKLCGWWVAPTLRRQGRCRLWQFGCEGQWRVVRGDRVHRPAWSPRNVPTNMHDAIMQSRNVTECHRFRSRQTAIKRIKRQTKPNL
jgi:hypothetical protein